MSSVVGRQLNRAARAPRYRRRALAHRPRRGMGSSGEGCRSTSAIQDRARQVERAQDVRCSTRDAEHWACRMTRLDDPEPGWERIGFPGGSLIFKHPDGGAEPVAVECVVADRDGREIARGQLVADGMLHLGAVRGIGPASRIVPFDVDRMVVNMIRQSLGLGRAEEPPHVR